MTHDDHDSLSWKTFDERTVYDNKWIRLVQVDVEAPDGQRWWHHVVRLQRVVMTIVLDDEDRLLMMFRHRFAIDEWGWEVPGGIVEAGESAAAAAVREVVEETGWRPGPLEHVLTFQPMPGMVDTPHEVFRARGAVKVGEPTDAEEASRIEWIPIDDVLDMAKRGEILGSGTLVGVLHILATRR